MSGLPHDLDQNISAMLDEMLSEQDSVALQRELLKNPEANAHMLGMKQANDDAGYVLCDAIAHSGQTRILPQQLIAENNPIRFPLRAMRYSAMAAGVMLVALMLYQFVPMGIFGFGGNDNQNTMNAGVIPAIEKENSLRGVSQPVEFKPEPQETIYAMDELVFGNMLAGEAVVERDIERSFFGYYDEVNDKFYWLETEETIEEVNTIELDI